MVHIPQEVLERAAALVDQADRVVCLTGAGVSAESGIPTFRDAQRGLWSRYRPEELASPEAFEADPGRVWRWYMWRLGLVEQAQPNPGHGALAQLARLVSHLTLITQNVDSLHEAAGSPEVVHLHGRLDRFRCHDCGQPYPLRPQDREADRPPTCPRCGGRVRPDVVWFGEPLPSQPWQTALAAVAACDCMLVVGTSAMVYPAAQLPQVARDRGARLLLVNPEPTPLDTWAEIRLSGPSGVVLPALVARVEARKGRPRSSEAA